MDRITCLCRTVLFPLAICLPAAGVVASDLQVIPPNIVLDAPEALQQLVVSKTTSDGDLVDLTRSAVYQVRDRNIVSVDQRGVVHPLMEGRTTIHIQSEADSLELPVEVRGLLAPAPLSFEQDVIPILTKARCNSGGCHGKAEGQNGFKLSVFGFDPVADHAALAQESRGRRVIVSAPQQSSFLLKATSTIPHGGGRKIDVDSLHYRRLARWIKEGAQFHHRPAEEIAIEVYPPTRLMRANESQQLQVTAIDVTGRRRCVTAESEYESNADSIARVDGLGLIVAGEVPGEASILIRYLGHVAICRITHPQKIDEFHRPAETNFIDGFVWDKLERLGIQPSPAADDATFVRRVFLDTIGTLPTPNEVRQFLVDQSVDKRSRLIDQLLQREEYSDFWTMRWSDLLRVDQDRTLPEGAVAMTRWLRRQISENRPYDEFVREILTVRGQTQAESPAAIYRVLDSPEALSRSFSQLLLGVRIECAQCHHHPFERWGQDDYFGLAGFFTGVGTKSLPNGTPAILVKAGIDLKHPRTEQVVAARALGAPAADFHDIGDRRQVFANWITANDNPYFAKVIANRMWTHYFGRGLVEPIDDFRATNPATNEPLLLALESHLRELRYDLRQFTKTLLNSQAYQRSPQTNDSNATDVQNFSHALDKALPAEVLLDAISQATGIPEKFPGWPEGYRAIQIWDNRLPSYFLKIFGRPLRASVCECERSNEPSISQALHLMNSPEILRHIQEPKGRARELSDSRQPSLEIVTQLFLATLSRFPTSDEQTLMLSEFERSDRRAAAEDILWALLNTREFLYNH